MRSDLDRMLIQGRVPIRTLESKGYRLLGLSQKRTVRLLETNQTALGPSRVGMEIEIAGSYQTPTH